MKRLRWTTILTAIILMMTFLLPACDSDTLSFSNAQEDELDQTIAGFMTDNHFPGVVLGAWVPGKGTYVVARGISDLDTGKPMQIDDKFGIGSITKSFVGTVALQLVDEGKLGLDDKVNTYISIVPNGDNITIRQLLDMTSGLFNYTEDESLLAAIVAEPLRKWVPEELVRAAVLHPPYFQPGADLYYSNTNTILVGLIIESITSNNLEDEIQRRIIDRLILKNTSFPQVPGMQAPYARGYQYDDEGKQYVSPLEIDPSFTWAAGAMISNLEDLKVWAEALGTGTLISEAMQTERLKFHDMNVPGAPAFFSDMDPGYGLAIERYDETFNFIGHSGRTQAYNAQMYYIPSQKAVLITLVNTDSTIGDGPLFFETVSKIIFPDSFPRIIGK